MYNFFLKYLENNEPQKVISQRGIKFRKCINPIIRKLAPLSGHYNLQIVRKSKIPKDVPIIFAPTHGFKDDMLYTLVTMDTHAYILFGSLPQFFHSFDGITAWLNGAILVDRSDRLSRRASIEKMIYAVNQGANLVIFPEGVWNKSENLPILKLYSGIYKVAKQTGAFVVPVATHIEGDTCYSILDEAFELSKYEEKEGMQILRDKMATIKWELMEKYSFFKRSDLEEQGSLQKQWDIYIRTLISQVKYYDYAVEDNAEYQDKNESSFEEIFDFMNHINIKKENAFLLNRR